MSKVKYYLLFLLFAYINGQVCDTADMQNKRYCHISGDALNFPMIRFFEGNNAYTKYGVFNGILHDPQSSQTLITNPTCANPQGQQLFLKWSQLINLPRSDLYPENASTQAVNNVMNPTSSPYLGIAAVGGFDGCAVSLTWDYSQAADRVDLYFTRAELDYPQTVATNTYLEGRTEKTFMHSFTGITQTDYPSPCAPTELYYSYKSNCFYFFLTESYTIVNICYTITTDNDRMCHIQWDESTAPNIYTVAKSGANYRLHGHPVEHQFSDGSVYIYYLLQQQTTTTRFRVDRWDPTGTTSGSIEANHVRWDTVKDTSGEISIGVIKDYALVIGYGSETPSNQFYDLSTADTLIKTENVAHKMLQAKQDKFYRMLLYGYNTADNGLYLMERTSTNKLTLSGTRIASSHFGIGRYYLVLTNIGNVANRDVADGDASIDYGSLYFDVYDIERYNHVGTYTSEYKGCKMTYTTDGVSPITDGQTCEDANDTDGDGCTAYCEVEAGWECLGIYKGCRRICGNGIIDTGEVCDEGSVTSSGQCLDTCTRIGDCYECKNVLQADGVTTLGVTCTLIRAIAPNHCCGDGTLDADRGEECDASDAADPYGHMCTNCVIDACTFTKLGEFFCISDDTQVAGKCGDNSACNVANLSTGLVGLANAWYSECGNNDWNQHDGCFRNCELDCDKWRLVSYQERSVASSDETQSISNIYYNNNQQQLILRQCKGAGSLTKYDYTETAARYCFEGTYCNPTCTFYQNVIGQPQTLRPTAALLPYLPSETSGPWEFLAFGDTINDLVFLIQQGSQRKFIKTAGGTWADINAAQNKAIPAGGIAATLVNDIYVGAQDNTGQLTYIQITDQNTLTSVGNSLYSHPDLRGHSYLFYWRAQNILLARHMDGTSWSMFNVATIDGMGTPERLKPPKIRMSGYLPFRPVDFPSSNKLAVIRQVNFGRGIAVKTYINIYEYDSATNIFSKVYTTGELTDTTVTSFGRDFNGQYLVYTYTNSVPENKLVKLKIADNTVTTEDNTENFYIIENAPNKYWVWIGGADGANNKIKKVDGDVATVWTTTDIYTAADFWVGQERFPELIGADDAGHFIGFMPFACTETEKQYNDNFAGVCLNFFMANDVDPAAPTLQTLVVA